MGDGVLTRYRIAAEVIAVLALVLGLIWGFHAYSEHERQIGRDEVQARWDAQKVADKLAADKQEKDWRDKYDAAINQGAKNAQALQTDAAAARVAADRLRDTNTSLQQLLANAPAETARQYASAYQAVFADCVGRYQEMGRAAQGHLNDYQTLDAAWPANGKEKAP